ncbi:MAG: tRNA dihydrouridine synthase [Pseudobdellovibrionaceae bacterium]
MLQSRILGLANFPVCFAPMVGLSHAATRMMVREYLPEGAETLWWTEMLNSRRVPYENFKTVPEVQRGAEEPGLVPQLLGNEEEPIGLSVKRLIEWGASAIDINMGCPVKKALAHNYGVSLMGDAAYAAEVVRITVKYSSVPVSVKLRAGLQGDFEYLYRFVCGLREAGASWITLHPRTAEQKRRGSADWKQILELKKRVDFPIIGNGDVQTAEDVFAMLDETQCDQVMVGRALCARPWLLWQVGEELGLPPPPGKSGPAPRTPEEEGTEYGRSLLRLIFYMRQFFPEENAIRKIRFYLRMSSVWLPFGLELTAKVSKAKTLSEIEEAISRFFMQTITMSQKTQLRQ